MLFEFVIPRVALDLASLLRSNADKVITSFRLSAALHSHGVNVRHLFRVYQCTTDASLRALIMVEMAARVIVADIRGKMRRTTRALPMAMVEAHYVKILWYARAFVCGATRSALVLGSTRINLVFGNTLASVGYWNKLVRKRVWAKFCLHLGQTPSAEVCVEHPQFMVGGERPRPFFCCPSQAPENPANGLLQGCVDGACFFNHAVAARAVCSFAANFRLPVAAIHRGAAIVVGVCAFVYAIQTFPAVRLGSAWDARQAHEYHLLRQGLSLPHARFSRARK